MIDLAELMKNSPACHNFDFQPVAVSKEKTHTGHAIAGVVFVLGDKHWMALKTEQVTEIADRLTKLAEVCKKIECGELPPETISGSEGAEFLYKLYKGGD
jgi:hypothetical protein